MTPELKQLKDHFQASYNKGFDSEQLIHFVKVYLNSVEAGAGDPLPEKPTCSMCQTEMAEHGSIEDPLGRMCSDCRDEFYASSGPAHKPTLNEIVKNSSNSNVMDLYRASMGSDQS